MERLGGKGLTAGLIAEDSFKQIGQPVSRQNHPPISNPACTDNVAHRKHRGCFNIATVLIPSFGNSNLSPVAISNLRRNLEALFRPRLKVSARKFGELAPLKLLAVSESRGLVS
jgi:hypothetical protein